MDVAQIKSGDEDGWSNLAIDGSSLVVGAWSPPAGLTISFGSLVMSTDQHRMNMFNNFRSQAEKMLKDCKTEDEEWGVRMSSKYQNLFELMDKYAPPREETDEQPMFKQGKLDGNQ